MVACAGDSSRPLWLSDRGPHSRRSRFAWLLSAATLGVLAALVAGIAAIGESGSPGTRAAAEPARGERELPRVAEAGPPRRLSQPIRRHGARASIGHPRSSSASLEFRGVRGAIAPARRPQLQCRPPSIIVWWRPATRRPSLRRRASERPPTPKAAQQRGRRHLPHAVAPTHYTSSSNSGSSSSSGSAQPIASDAPFAGHRSRHLQLPVAHAHQCPTGR